MTSLWLHGIGTGPEAWEPQLEALGGEAPDLRPLYRAGWAETLAAAEQLEGDDLCGLSLGALVALHVASVRPVRRLVVCAGFARLPRARRAQVGAIAALVRLAPRRALGVGLSGREVSRLMRAAARFELGLVTAPTLVLWGERDRANASLGRALAAELPNATAQEIAAAGHVANLDNPDAFTAAVAGFLGTRAPPAV